MIGIPGETRQDFLDTVRLCAITNPDFYSLSIFYPYPGTELHDVAAKNRLINTPKNFVEREVPTLSLPDLPSDDIIYFKRVFNDLRHNYLPQKSRLATLHNRVRFHLLSTPPSSNKFHLFQFIIKLDELFFLLRHPSYIFNPNL